MNGHSTESEQRANEVKARHSDDLFKIDGVVGVGVERDSSGRFFLSVQVTTDDPSQLDQLPTQLEDLPVKVTKTEPYERFSSRDET